MNCSEIKARIDDYYDRELTLLENQAIEEHLSACDDCSREFQEISTLRRALNSLPVVEADKDLEKRIFAEVRRHYAGQGHSRFAAGFMTAMAASLALWFVSSILITHSPIDQQQVVMLGLYESQTVRLNFEAPADIEQVTLSLDLPANIELDGYKGRTELTWQTRLKKGQNILALPLKAIASGQGELVAQLQYGERSRNFRIVLKTADNDVMYYEIQEFESV